MSEVSHDDNTLTYMNDIDKNHELISNSSNEN